MAEEQKRTTHLTRDKAGCSRDVIHRGAEQLGWTLDELIERTILAVQSFLS